MPKVMIIDDEENVIETVKAQLEEEFTSCEIFARTRFNDNGGKLDVESYDLLILDLKDDKNKDSFERNEFAGLTVIDNLKKSYFLPVIIYTGHSEQCNLETVAPLVQIVTKGDDTGLIDAVRRVLDSKDLKKFSEIKSEINVEIARMFWEELVNNWGEYRSENTDLSWINDVMVPRLASYFASKLHDGELVSANRVYICPPIGSDYLPGDILQKNISEEQSEWYVLLTPACDLVRRGSKRKAKSLTLVQATEVKDTELYRHYKEAGNSKRKQQELIDMLRSMRNYFLPEWRTIPHLVVEFERAKPVSEEEIEEMERVASLAPPYAEALLAERAAFVGRIGKPDLDLKQMFPGPENG